jgi:signal transduction histidine kinase
VRDQYGEIVGKSGNLQDFELPLDPKDFPLLEKKGALFNTLNGFAIQTRRRVSDLPDYRLISYVVRRPGLPLLILQVAAPMGSLERNQERLKTLLFLLVPISLLIAGGLGFWLTNRAFRPVRLMMKKTSEIQLADLRERLPLPTGDWELTELAITLNRLLDRVESAVKLQERFVSDASHQLKTPLAILRGEIELLLQTSVPDHVKNVLTSLGQEVSQLGKLVENLLILARADSGGFTLQLESVRLDELLLDLVARFEHYAHSKGIQLKFDTETNPTQGDGVVDFEIRGDGALLRSLIQNLIDNAIKYSSSGGTVFIRLQETAQACIVEVQDQGAGISPTDLDRIFERFYRSPNHTASTSGAGLGLPIAKKIAELHGGQLSAQSKLGAGATFRFRVEKSS